MLKKRPHKPAHLFVDNAAYFLASSIYQKLPLFKPEAVKQQLLATIDSCFRENNWQLDHWVILDNHNHLLATSAAGGDLPKIFFVKSTACQHSLFKHLEVVSCRFGGITGIIARVMKKIICSIFLLSMVKWLI